jgi:hypothetical protein
MSEIIPSHDVVTPVLVVDADLNSASPQSKAFTLKHSGRHSLNVQLKLKRGPQGRKDRYEEYVLAGTVEIHDERGRPKLKKAFERTFLEYEVGAKLLDFDADDVGVGQERTFVVTLDVSPSFVENYSEMQLFIRKEPKYRIVD